MKYLKEYREMIEEAAPIKKENTIMKKNNMTYRELLKLLKVMEANAPNSLGDTVTVYNPYEDEFIAVVDTDISGEENDVLDEGHLFLVLKA